LKNPGIVSIPLGFLAAWLGTILSNDTASQLKFDELTVRANTGLGAEKATAH
jgi:cation/acetate symporter